MSSIYRTTVIDDRKNEEYYFFHPDLSSVMHWGENNAEIDNQVKIDEVIQDACGDFLVAKGVMEYVKQDD